MSLSLPRSAPSALEYFATLVADDESLSLTEAAVAIAQDDYPQLDVQQVLAELDALGERLRRRLPADAPPQHRLRMLSQYFHGELGFAGNVNDYYAADNSYVHQVLASRRGIPITLSVVFMELASHVGLRVRGVCFPGHFLMKLRLPQGEVVLDPFSGRSLGRSELDEFLDPWRQQTDQPMALESYLGSASSRQILVRMLRNLRQLHQQGQDWPRLLRVQQRLVTLLPQDERERIELALCLAQLSRQDPGVDGRRLH